MCVYKFSSSGNKRGCNGMVKLMETWNERDEQTVLSVWISKFRSSIDLDLILSSAKDASSLVDTTIQWKLRDKRGDIIIDAIYSYRRRLLPVPHNAILPIDPFRDPFPLKTARMPSFYRRGIEKVKRNRVAPSAESLGKENGRMRSETWFNSF